MRSCASTGLPSLHVLHRTQRVNTEREETSSPSQGRREMERWRAVSSLVNDSKRHPNTAGCAVRQNTGEPTIFSANATSSPRKSASPLISSRMLAACCLAVEIDIRDILLRSTAACCTTYELTVPKQNSGDATGGGEVRIFVGPDPIR